MAIYLLKKIIKSFLFLFAIGSWIQLYAQANFTAICQQKKIGKNDYLQIEFRMQNASDVESIDPPSFKNFSIVSGPNQATTSSNINGKVDQSVSISFVLKPNGPGNYTIGPATAKADGKEFTSNPVNIQVTNSSAVSSSTSNLASTMSPFTNFNFDIADEPMGQDYDDYILKKGENINDKIKKDLILKTDVSKTTCYVGEPIVATFKMYSRLRMETSISSEPSFNGFSVSDMDLNNRNSSFQGKYDGRGYNVYILRKVQLSPLQAGTVTIDPLVTENNISFMKEDYAHSQSGNPFLDMMQNFANAMPQEGSIVQKQVTLQSDPVIITVKPLPDAGKPSGFKGAVGNFTIQSTLQKNKLTTDDAGNLKIIISGQGNIQMINAPKINWPQGIDGYDAQIADAINKNEAPMKGTKTFTYPFTISKEGTYTIPAISFSFFDPVSGTYKNLSTQPLSLEVTKGKGIPASITTNTVVAQNATGIGNELEKYGLYGGIGIIVIAGLIFLGFRKGNSNKLTSKVEVLSKQHNAVKENHPVDVIPVNPLEEAHQKLMTSNGTGFYHSLDVSLKKYLSEKFKVPVNELTKNRINEELDKGNVALGTSLRLTSLMEKIELNLYTPPSTTNEIADAYDKASEVISLLDKQC